MLVSEALLKNPWMSGAPQLVLGGVYFCSACAKATGATERTHKTETRIDEYLTAVLLR